MSIPNLRSAYAECSAAVLTETTAETTSNGVTVSIDKDVVTCTKTYTYTQAVSGWITADPSVGSITPPEGGKGTKITITVKSDGKCCYNSNNTVKQGI